MKLNESKLLGHLKTILNGVETGDTLEGSIEFTIMDPDYWEVTAAYRVNNLQGQGGMILIPPTDPLPPALVSPDKLRWVATCEGCDSRIEIVTGFDDDRALEWSANCPYCDNGNEVLFVSAGIISASQTPTTPSIRAHVEGCLKALSVPVDLCECGGRDFLHSLKAETRAQDPT